MRTNVTLEPDVVALLKRVVESRGVGPEQAVNDALRASLPRYITPFHQETASLGEPRLDLDRALRIAGELEDRITPRRPLDEHSCDGRLIVSVLRNRSAIRDAALRHGITSIGVFGSVAVGQSTRDSDVDFAVKTEEGTSLFDLARLRADLIGILDSEVDVVSLGDPDDALQLEIESEMLRL